MSRRGRHGRHPHPHAPRQARPAAPAAPRPDVRAEPATAPAQARVPEAVAPLETEAIALADTGPSPVAPFVPLTPAPPPTATDVPADRGEAGHLRPGRLGGTPVDAPVTEVLAPAFRPGPAGELPGADGGDAGQRRAACTVAQLRRFIKSRPWVPMHELRRRFGIDGADDDVTPIRVGESRIFVGLPPAEGQVLAELLGGGDVGYELSVDPWTPVVIGVYPMRPVPRT